MGMDLKEICEAVDSAIPAGLTYENDRREHEEEIVRDDHDD